MTDNKKQIVELTDAELEDLKNKSAAVNDALFELWNTLNDLEGYHCNPQVAYNFGSAYRTASDAANMSVVMHNVITSMCLFIKDSRNGKV